MSLVNKRGNAKNSYDIPKEERITIVHNRKIRCANDHPVVYYIIEEDGFAVCGYCDMKYVFE